MTSFMDKESLSMGFNYCVLLGSNVWPLLHESTPIVPETVVQIQGVL